MPTRSRRNRPAVRAEVQKRAFLKSIERAVFDHDLDYHQAGMDRIDSLSDFRLLIGKGELLCKATNDNGSKHNVVIELGPDRKTVSDAYCSCRESDQTDWCSHTLAALWELGNRSSNPEDSLYQRICGDLGSQNTWQSATQQIDTFLANQHQVEEQNEASTTSKLCWRIDLGIQLDNSSSSPNRVDVVPYEQRITKKGNGWTKGRKVAWDRILYEPSLLTTTADEEVFKLVKQASGHYRSLHRCSLGGYYDLDSFDVLLKLYGHPHVVWQHDPTQQVTVRRGEAGLAVVEIEDGLQLIPKVEGVVVNEKSYLFTAGDDSPGTVQIDLANHQIYVSELRSETMRLLEEIEKLRPIFPLDAEDDLLKRVAELEAYLPVELPERLQGQSATADTKIYLRLSPAEPRGLNLAMNVRPASGGPLFDPGKGRTKLTSVVDGQRAVVAREFSDEVARANEISELLGLEQHTELRAWRWKIESDDDALDMLAIIADRQSDDLVVEWPQGVAMSVSQSITPASLRVQIDDRNDWFGLKGTVELDGQKIPVAELMEAVRKGQRYIAIGNNRFAQISKLFRERLAALDEVVHHGRQGMEIDITAAPVLEELLDKDVTLRASRRWRSVLKKLDQATELNPDPPITLTAELRDYQLEGYRWLRRLAAWGVGGCLADDMGLGKTVQTLAVMIDRMEEGPTLVVAPTSVGFNWVRECERFAPTLKPILYRETDRDDFLKNLGDGDVVIASYGLLMRDGEKLAKVSWGTLVLDEAQKVKNSQTKTAKEVYKINAKWRLALTGTPMENHLGELWSIFRAISPGLFGSWERFRSRFAEPIERRNDAPRRHALARLVRPFMLRRTKSEVLDELPERTEIRRTAQLSTEEKKRYEDARLSAVAQLAGISDTASDGKDRRFEVLAALTKLRQLACHPKLVDPSWNQGSAKLNEFLEIVEELREGGHRALVFSQFTKHLTLIREELDSRKISYQYLDGKTPAKKRQQSVDAFQHGEGELFLISLKAGGTGLNLTGADYVIHMDPWWNPAVEDQATDRAHRIGQTRPVTVYRIVTEDTIEEQILAMHSRKRDLVAGVLEGADRAAKLSTEELVELIRGDQLSATTA